MSKEALDRIQEYAAAGAELRSAFFAEQGRTVMEIARAMAVCLARGGRILLAGNGGSAADAQHLAAEFVNRFRLERPPLPAVALTTDTSVLTAIGNDYGFDQVFVKQVQALGGKGDMFVAMSTSGNSPNISHALRAARDRGMVCVGLSGRTGGEMQPLCDWCLLVGDKRTPLIQEIHITAGHLFCDLVDYYLFEAVQELEPYLADRAG